MNMKLSNEKEHLVLDNQRLVHYLVQRLGVTPNSSEYEDIVSIGMIALVKAAITFDPYKKFKFTTYASRCIINEIFRHYRKANKYSNEISIDEPIGDDGEGKKLTLSDTLENPNSNFVEEIANKDAFIQLVSIVLNYLESRNRIVMLYRMGNISQRDIAKKLNITQGHVSRINQKAILRVQEIANQQVHYKEVFSMDIIGDTYKITFASKDISNFNKIFATLLQNLTSATTLPDFKVNCNRERIIIQIPAQPESFSFIAQIIQEIDDFSMTFVSGKDILPADNTVPQEVELDDKDKSNDTVEEIMLKDPLTGATIFTSTETDTGVETDTGPTVERGSQVKQVRDYMLSMNSFTVKELKQHFPNLSNGTINNALCLAKNKGLITATSRGKYRVNGIKP